MRLDILICSLPESYSIAMLKRLRKVLDPQIARYQGQVNLKIHDAGRFMPTGTKRNELIKNNDAEYFVFIDCDDLVSDTYVDDIMKALESNPDCVTMKGTMTTNGADKRDWTIRLGSPYVERNKHFYRWPNHLAVMKRAKVCNIKFPDVWEQEDFLWSKKIHELRLLKTEVHIDKQIYFYDYRTDKPNRNRR